MPALPCSHRGAPVQAMVPAGRVSTTFILHDPHPGCCHDDAASGQALPRAAAGGAVAVHRASEAVVDTLHQHDPVTAHHCRSACVLTAAFGRTGGSYRSEATACLLYTSPSPRDR